MPQPSSQLSLPFEVVPRGDGSFIVTPGKPQLGREKISIAQAVQRFGASTATWLRLYDSGFIEGERPSPRKTFLYVDSICQHLKSSQDPEFWNLERRQKFFSAI